MSANPLISIIVNNYNYERFLSEAINSALEQTYPNIEVIVVDDGSTDNSRSIIAQYESKVIQLLKENGGQTSAMNYAFKESKGDIVCFIDADDVLEADCIERVVKTFLENESVIKVHWPLLIIDAFGTTTGEIIPKKIKQSNVLEQLLSQGPDVVTYPPTSGNAWKRSFLEQVLPLPEIEKKLGVGSASADACLSLVTPLYGKTESLTQPFAFYRVHGNNDYVGTAFEKRIRRDREIFNHLFHLVQYHCQKKNYSVDVDKWLNNSWIHRINQVIDRTIAIVPENEDFILVDDLQLKLDKTFFGRRWVPFTEREGKYWGPPSNDLSAINEIERQRQIGVKYMVFAWMSFWWLDYYKGMEEYLTKNYKAIVRDDTLIAFDLQGTSRN
jgi:glycosyltransferase involved in cell wall biosynthesis